MPTRSVTLTTSYSSYTYEILNDLIQKYRDFLLGSPTGRFSVYSDSANGNITNSARTLKMSITGTNHKYVLKSYSNTYFDAALTNAAGGSELFSLLGGALYSALSGSTVTEIYDDNSFVILPSLTNSYGPLFGTKNSLGEMICGSLGYIWSNVCLPNDDALCGIGAGNPLVIANDDNSRFLYPGKLKRSNVTQLFDLPNVFQCGMPEGYSVKTKLTDGTYLYISSGGTSPLLIRIMP